MSAAFGEGEVELGHLDVERVEAIEDEGVDGVSGEDSEAMVAMPIELGPSERGIIEGGEVSELVDNGLGVILGGEAGVGGGEVEADLEEVGDEVRGEVLAVLDEGAEEVEATFLPEVIDAG